MRSWKSHFNKRQRPIKFIIVGFWNSVFGYGMFYLLDTLFLSLFQVRYMAYMSALTLAQILCVISAYLFHKHITFESIAKGRAMGMEFIRFVFTYGVTFCVYLLMLPVLAEVFHIEPKIAMFLLVAVTTLMSYFGHSRYSFKY